MKQAASYIVLLFWILALSCTDGKPRQLRPGDYIRYVESEQNELRTTVSSGIWRYTIQYKPAAYIALKEQDPGQIDGNALNARVRKLEKTVWFNVSIKVGNEEADPLRYHTTNLEEYNERLNYFLAEASKNFRLTYGESGEMDQIGYYLENNYNIKPEIVAIVGFRIPDTAPVQPLVFSYYDGLLSSGIVKFKVPVKAVQSIPIPIIS